MNAAPQMPEVAAPKGQAGAPDRFGRRWRLVGAGLSNVWRFGDLELPAASGRLLLRGLNGTGKTTALEALWPYLLDLNATRLAAGKARPTSLSSLMREGAAGKRRFGYAWLTLCGPGDEGVWSYGVRLQFSEGGSPPVRVVPFAVPGRPLHDLALYVEGRTPLTAEQFEHEVIRCRGQVFADEDAYVAHLSARLFAVANTEPVITLATRLRQVRNPTLLGEVSPQAAADALRESLPGVADEVVAATAEALAESESTRQAFAKDREASELLGEFGAAWCAHAAEVVTGAHSAALEAAKKVRACQGQLKTRGTEHEKAHAELETAASAVRRLEGAVADAEAEVRALEAHQAYQDAGRLADLRTTLDVRARASDAAARAMQGAARAAVSRGESLRRELDNLIEDVNECVADAVEGGSTRRPPILSWTDAPRPVLRAGAVTADAGPELVIHGTPDLLKTTAASWNETADARARESDAAALALSDRRTAQVAEAAAVEADRAAREAAATADAAVARAERAGAAAREESAALLTAVAAWTQANSRLAMPAGIAGGEERPEEAQDEGWLRSDVDELATAEPGQVLATCEGWQREAQQRAEAMAAELRSRSQAEAGAARDLRRDAAALRAEARELRQGRLLPLPRPEWAGAGDDEVALGSALEWQPTFGDERERALLEEVFASAGLLGATLSPGGASSPAWRVDALGREVAPSLANVVAVDPEHPLSGAAAAVLARIALAPTADVPSCDEAGLIVGRDGTFRAGVLHGRVPGAADPAKLVSSRHVGARRRRAAALRKAEELDAQAVEIERQAAEREGRSTQLRAEADGISTSSRRFPPTAHLRAAESKRAALVSAAREAQDHASEARTRGDEAHANARQELAAWVERTRAVGLPAELPRLERMRDGGAAAASRLRLGATRLAKLADRLAGVIARRPVGEVEDLERFEAVACEAFREAADTRTAVEVLEQTAGAAIADVLARHEAAQKRLAPLRLELNPARKTQLEAVQRETAARHALDEAGRKLRDAEPGAAEALGALRALLEVPGVADAVLDGEPPRNDESLLRQVESKLRDRRTITKKTLRERADTVRAGLAGTWSLDPGEDHGELLTWVLTHRDESYTPTQAAAHAATLRRRAEQALQATEERALREFVLGRLPGAIGTAWTRLHDWVSEVNRKMRSASASSGVGVQVRVPRRGGDDLSAASKTVLELACEVSDAERTPDQQRCLGEALQALLAAAPGETMQQRVASAVDVREWVDLEYEITRPGGKSQRWNSKTGLSGGERRLVVLAPMLAAIAAAYDRFGPQVLRIVPLDEVPAEVDERGREGLARYIAALDLDLVCTSYLWDGCPGAWDGIDAHDLEAGPDGTVVAFPMLVRGLAAIPELGRTPAPERRS
ncbi:SbcC/MukB-like Walker B domain-containing protein [Anaeromyxobacter sp. Fw109-5]|uniref:SbcC/MukB-like Walker B domain-containing protein n=1 Tax=Anaeromyxobacter sp. (strain Fw109-5) TaxID=404589 RepID=UPI0000ED80BE|nr:SbcC/MukB-like Walker B domain-containing protein [Anaeromyxobacter sp. Fw109-5]ABS25282.1 hypothetical protein Anae109_1074 [Anaeromyxobacter sp. Fw109-5]